MIPALSPCGLAVDLLRSCYETQMRLVAGDDRSILVRWYFVDDDTPFLPFETAFYSHIWDGDPKYWDDSLGEVLGAPRTYTDGSRPGNAPGLVVCGTAEAFRDGAGAYPAEPIQLGGLGTPLCCFPAGYRSSTWCAVTESNLQATLRVDFTPRANTGFAGAFMDVPPCALAYAPPCGYTGTCFDRLHPSGELAPATLTVSIGAAGVFVAKRNGLVDTDANWNRLHSWDGITPLTVTGGVFGFAYATPATLLLTPAASQRVICPVTAVAEWDLYALTVAAFPPGTYGDRVRPGSWPIRQSGPCTWSGRIPTLRRTSAQGPPVPMILGIDSTRALTATFDAEDLVGRPLTIVYRSPAGWDGMSTVALLRLTTDVIPGWVWPLRMQVTWPGTA